MPIVFEPKLKEYSKPFRELLNTYFLGKSFDSLESALSHEYKKDHPLRELFEIDSVTRTFKPNNLPATLDDKVSEVNILWRQYEEIGNMKIELPGLPVLTAKFIPN